MNGRLYDPLIGRMLSPDNYVADATSTQDYNRYSYVKNNPLKYTDPSGWTAYPTRFHIANDDPDVAPAIGGGNYNPDVFDWQTAIAASNNSAPQYNTVIGNYSFSPQAWAMINAAWNTAYNSGFDAVTFSYTNGVNTAISYSSIYSTMQLNENTVLVSGFQWYRDASGGNATDSKGASGQGFVETFDVGGLFSKFKSSDFVLQGNSSSFRAVGPVVGFLSTTFSALEQYHGRNLSMVEERIASRAEAFGTRFAETQSLRAAKAEATFGKEAAGAFGKVLTPLSVGLSAYDLVNSVANKDGWGAVRATTDIVMTVVGVYCPVAGFIYFGGTFVYDIYKMSKEP